MADPKAALKKKVDALKTKISAGAQLSPAELKILDEYYGPVARLISSNKELYNIFRNALKSGQGLSSMGQEAFMKSVRGTAWYGKTTENQRNYEVFSKNPQNAAQLEAKNAQIQRSVENTVVEVLGLNAEDPAVAAKIQEAVQTLSRDYFSDWMDNVDWVTKGLFKDVKATELGGAIANNEVTIRNYYQAMGISLSDRSMDEYTHGLIGGTISLDTIQKGVRDSAAKMWAPFADRINAGETVDDILYPYKKMIGDMLELDPQSLDMTDGKGRIDPLLNRALFSSADPKGVMSLTDLRKAIKADSRWQKTKNAKDEYASLTTELMRMFGAAT